MNLRARLSFLAAGLVVIVLGVVFLGLRRTWSGLLAPVR